MNVPDVYSKLTYVSPDKICPFNELRSLLKFDFHSPFREGSQFIVVNNNPSQDYNRSNALVSSINFTFLSIDWNSLIVGKISPWLDLDSTNEIVKKNSELVSRLLYYFTFNNHYW